MCFGLCGFRYVYLHNIYSMHVYVCVRVCTHPLVSSLIYSIQKAVYCSQNKAEDKPLWIWQLSDSSTVRLEEKCIVKAFTEIISNAWQLTAATKNPIPKKKLRKQCTMVLTSSMKIFQLSAAFFSPPQLLSSPTHSYADVKPTIFNCRIHQQ